MPLSLKLLSKALPAIGIGLLAADDVGFDKIYKKAIASECDRLLI
ncbi:MAG: hypothetical protein RM368_10990 [Nostoc sp. DedSLP03]|nr:hypothetical protein [Nostoc sp. DedSLP03]MDZ7965488.1 hypothetical protein [Nostoc sp. DedSLP03]